MSCSDVIELIGVCLSSIIGIIGLVIGGNVCSYIQKIENKIEISNIKNNSDNESEKYSNEGEMNNSTLKGNVDVRY